MTPTSSNPILIIGASGLVGRRLANGLLAEGHKVRCLARDPSKLQDLAAKGCEIVGGDIADLSAVRRAMRSVRATYIAIHTLSPQPGGGRSRFMDIEKRGLQNVVTASRSSGARRIIYVTSLGIGPSAKGEWLRERWGAEELLINSGLDVTILRPGHIVGVGGRGFDTMVGNAKRSTAFALGGERPRMRTIAVDDLVYYLVGLLDESRSFGHRYDVGSDDVLSINQLIDSIADVLGRPHPRKIQIPLPLLGALSPLVERMGKLPAGAMKGLVDSVNVDLIGDPAPIRQLLPRSTLNFRQSVQKELGVP